MASVSYSWTVGQSLEQVTASTNAPSGGSGTIELRIDQTATAVTDAAYAGSSRPLTRADVLVGVQTLLEYLQQDSNVFPGVNPPT